MELEKLVKTANLDYRLSRSAIIQKIETPIAITGQGLVMKQSTVDFIGCVMGKAIAFDAKETTNKTSFPLANIKKHQLDFLDYWEAAGGIAFFLIHFVKVHEDSAFITPLSLIHKYWDNPNGRKSIPISDFEPPIRKVLISNYLEPYL